MESVVKQEIKKHPKTSILTFVLLLTLVVAFVGALRQHNWIPMLMIVVISILICLPRIIGRLSNIEIPAKLGVYIILFIYTTLFLGELKNFYVRFWWWDVLLHISSGLAFGIIGFIILYILYKAEKIKTSPKIIAMFSFAFALAIGALWEIVEFTIDYNFGTSLQGGSLVDTMKDLIDDSIGALFSTIMGYLYVKKESGIVVKPMIKEFKKDNPKLFEKK